MNRKALKQMRRMLLQIAAQKWQPMDESMAGEVEWNLSEWCKARWREDGPCGYTACAIGHAMLDPVLGPQLDNEGAIEVMGTNLFPREQRLMDFFGFVAPLTFQILFMPVTYANKPRGPQYVAYRIDRLLELNSEEKLANEYYEGEL